MALPLDNNRELTDDVKERMFALGRDLSINTTHFHEDFRSLKEDHEYALIEYEAGTIVSMIFRELTRISPSQDHIDIYISVNNNHEEDVGKILRSNLEKMSCRVRLISCNLSISDIRYDQPHVDVNYCSNMIQTVNWNQPKAAYDPTDLLFEHYVVTPHRHRAPK